MEGAAGCVMLIVWWWLVQNAGRLEYKRANAQVLERKDHSDASKEETRLAQQSEADNEDQRFHSPCLSCSSCP
jgi:hypothetical protein